MASEFDESRDKHFIGLSCGCSARRVEARHNLGAINRTQQAFYLENNRFADSLKEIGLGIKTETTNYRYRIIQPMMPVQELDRSGSSDSDVLIRMAIAQKKENIKIPTNVHSAILPGVQGFFPETGLLFLGVIELLLFCDILILYQTNIWNVPIFFFSI